MKYNVRYCETNEGWFEVEAENEVDAYNKFWNMVETGEINLLNTEIIESEAYVYGE